MTPLPISGYVLAGGRSSRMGTDKALLPLAGRPLIAHAVAKLRRICASVHILSANPALAPYAPLVPDLHPDTGPIGGIEAALAHTSTDWNLVLPVDVPFLPTAFLDWWTRAVVGNPSTHTRVAMFSDSGIPQPTVLLIHRAAAPPIADAVARGDRKLVPILRAIAPGLSPSGAWHFDQTPYRLPGSNLPFDSPSHPAEPWQTLTPAQRAAQPLWFANLNTPADLAEAASLTAALDT